MVESQKNRTLDIEAIKSYGAFLYEWEKEESTIHQYICNLHKALLYFGDIELTKTALIEWKEHLAKEYAPASVNTILAALNGFLKFMGWDDLRVKPLKIQKTLFTDGSRELSREEYARLVRAAEKPGNRRLSLVLQTICSTGIRVSELKFITVAAVQAGRAEVSNKGKRRTVFLPKKLSKVLLVYMKEQKIREGPVFVTRSGKPLDRSNIWRDMKALCESAGVDPVKVFPHNLRHLFARTYYSVEKDLSRLADILGHSSVNTTRIYTIESGTVHLMQLERLGLLIT